MRKKRIISILIAVMMVFALFPATALGGYDAYEPEGYGGDEYQEIVATGGDVPIAPFSVIHISDGDTQALLEAVNNPAHEGYTIHLYPGATFILDGTVSAHGAFMLLPQPGMTIVGNGATIDASAAPNLGGARGVIEISVNYDYAGPGPTKDLDATIIGLTVVGAPGQSVMHVRGGGIPPAQVMASGITLTDVTLYADNSSTTALTIFGVDDININNLTVEGAAAGSAILISSSTNVNINGLDHDGLTSLTPTIRLCTLFPAFFGDPGLENIEVTGIYPAEIYVALRLNDTIPLEDAVEHANFDTINVEGYYFAVLDDTDNTGRLVETLNDALAAAGPNDKVLILANGMLLTPLTVSGEVLFREARPSSDWFYCLGAGIKCVIENPDPDGFFENPLVDFTMEFCAVTSTFTLNVSEHADRIAINFAGILAALGVDPIADDFTLHAQRLGGALLDIFELEVALGDTFVHIYPTLDVGWDPLLEPVYFLVSVSDTLPNIFKIIVDGVVFNMELNVIPMVAEVDLGTVLFKEARLGSAGFYHIGSNCAELLGPGGGFTGTSPFGAIVFDAETNTFTLTLSCTADLVAVDFRGLIGDALGEDVQLFVTGDFASLAPGLAVTLVDGDPGVAIYSTVDDGWGVGHYPAYVMVDVTNVVHSTPRTNEFTVAVGGVVMGTFTVVFDRIDADEPTVTVGEQVGTLTQGRAGSVTFPVVVTCCVPDGEYVVSVAGLPNGVSYQEAVLIITDGVGTLTLTGTNAIVAGEHSLTLNITLYDPADPTIVLLELGPSAPFTLTIDPPPPPGGGGVGGGVVTPPEVPYGPFIADHIWYVRGYPDGSFRPGQAITRAEIAMILWRLLDSEAKYANRGNSFSDVTTGWYARAVSYLEFRNIVQGYEDGTFRPNNPITRAELTAMMSRFFEMDETGVNNFTDVSVTHWAIAYINNAHNKGWVEGDGDGTFRPNAPTSRAEAVTIINRVLERVPNPVTINYHLANTLYELTGETQLFNDITSAHWAFFHVMEAAIEHDFDLVDGREVWSAIQIPWLEIVTPSL